MTTPSPGCSCQISRLEVICSLYRKFPPCLLSLSRGEHSTPASQTSNPKKIIFPWSNLIRCVPRSHNHRPISLHCRSTWLASFERLKIFHEIMSSHSYTEHGALSQNKGYYSQTETLNASDLIFRVLAFLLAMQSVNKSIKIYLAIYWTCGCPSTRNCDEHECTVVERPRTLRTVARYWWQYNNTPINIALSHQIKSLVQQGILARQSTAARHISHLSCSVLLDAWMPCDPLRSHLAQPQP
jgi:hypothetical protein